jgi:hypothetical protein
MVTDTIHIENIFSLISLFNDPNIWPILSELTIKINHQNLLWEMLVELLLR